MPDKWDKFIVSDPSAAPAPAVDKWEKFAVSSAPVAAPDPTALANQALAQNPRSAGLRVGGVSSAATTRANLPQNVADQNDFGGRVMTGVLSNFATMGQNLTTPPLSKAPVDLRNMKSLIAGSPRYGQFANQTGMDAVNAILPIQELRQGDYAGAASKVITNEILRRGAGAVGATAGDLIQDRPAPIPIDPATQVNRQTAALSPSPKANIPEALTRANAELNTTAASLPKKPANVGDFVERVVKPTNARLETKYQAWMDPIRTDVVDMTPIKQAIIQKAQSFPRPAARAAAAEWVNNNIDDNLTTEGLDKLRQTLNQDVKFPGDSVSSAAELHKALGSKVAAQEALRLVKQELYNRVAQAGGVAPEDVATLKNTQSSLMKITKSGEAQAQKLDIAQRKAAVQPLGEQVYSNVIKPAANLKAGSALEGLARMLANGKKSPIATRANANIKKSF